ncbi:hypothetical protein GCM10011390_47760 [Aureimonas endophytica]|uniref:Glycosyl transferase family 2 n=1 Tax=Aureimonas endophytica TaxID=2027858 RepID=A0A917A337_9HYPH|nr:hypothetical protein [Aureimonas endophytica]GGE22798.1 hypothetical protein GCM10011390_47760 [Aureimonas endophytica]
MSEARCPVCAARLWQETARQLRFPGELRSYRFACGSCGLLADDPAEAAGARDALDRRLAAPTFAADPALPFGLDLYTLRTAATRFGRRAVPGDAAQAAALREPHGALAAVAGLADLDAGLAPRVALGLLCRARDLPALWPGLAAHAAWTDEIHLLLDGEAPPAPPGPVPAGLAIRLAARPLGDDFAAQRNALQALGGKPWMLQLDADETIAPPTGRLLTALTRLAEASGAVSIGLARRNLVDGALSDLFPDTQYRLNHRDIRFAGRVHERPQRDWPQSFISLHGPIEHHLGGAHVAARSRRYEAIAPGEGRLDEESALRRPYRA